MSLRAAVERLVRMRLAIGPWAARLSRLRHSVGRRTQPVHQTSLTRYAPHNMGRSPMRLLWAGEAPGAPRALARPHRAPAHRLTPGRSAQSPPEATKQCQQQPPRSPLQYTAKNAQRKVETVKKLRPISEEIVCLPDGR